ncbi:MAG: hypothetical protein HC915_13165 [Anaerolineae bacterium]|nr:hypothetical protein [Anaerolineae bacterium]
MSEVLQQFSEEMAGIVASTGAGVVRVDQILRPPRIKPRSIQTCCPRHQPG